MFPMFRRSRKHVLHKLVMCWSNDNSGSTITPRSLTLLDSGTVVSPKWNDLMFVCSRRAVVPTKRHSVLVSLSFSLLVNIHALMWSQHSAIWTVAVCASVGLGLKLLWSWVSSAYNCQEIWNWSMRVPRSFVYSVKRTGPSTDPWGTPHWRWTLSEKQPSMNTACWRFVKSINVNHPNTI